MWYKRKVVVPDGQETIYEIITEEDGLGFGLAVADVVRSVPHLHRHTREKYVLVSGRLQVVIGNGTHHLCEPGHAVDIPLNAVHWAKSANEAPARILVLTFPPWSPDDHVIQDGDERKPA